MIIDPKSARELTAEEVAAMSLVGDLATNHPDKVADLLYRHGFPADDDREKNIMKLAALSEERQRFFDEDFGNTASMAGYHYWDWSKIMDGVKKVVQQGKKTFVNAYAPGMGEMAVQNEQRSKGFIQDLLGRVFNRNKQQPGQGGVAQDLNQDPAALQLKQFLANNPGGSTSDGMILGIPKKQFWTGAVVVVILAAVIIVIVKLSRKKKAVKAAA
jgi:hypothetical protein